MSIRLKIVLVVLPLVIVTLLLTGVSSYFSASTGITRIARDFLGFKAQELRNNADSQWRLLVDNGLTGRTEMVEATKAAVEAYARSLVRSPTEIVFAVDADGGVRMASAELGLTPGETQRLASIARAKTSDLVSIPVAGRERVAKGFWFEPFGWFFLVSEERAVFYARATEITVRTAIILVAAIAITVVLVLLLARYLGRPITRVVSTMKDIIVTNDLSERVPVEYDDEIGRLAQTFNLMVGELEQAYGQISSMRLQGRRGAEARAEDPQHLPEVRAEGRDRPVLQEPRGHARGREPGARRAVLGHPQLHDHLREDDARRPGGLAQPLLHRHGRRHHRPQGHRGQVHRRRDHGVLRRAGEARGRRAARRCWPASR